MGNTSVAFFSGTIAAITFAAAAACKQAVVTDTSAHICPDHSQSLVTSFPGCSEGCVYLHPHFKISATLFGLTNYWKVLLSTLFLGDCTTKNTIVCLTYLAWFPCEVTHISICKVSLAFGLQVGIYLICFTD